MVNKTDILTMSNTIYDYFSKNKTYPKSVQVKGVTYTIQEATYLLASFVVKQDNNIDKVKVGGASNPNGDRVNRKVIKTVYTDMAKRLKQYITANKKLPNYVTIKDNQKCSIILFMFQLSKIVKYYKDHNKLPNDILIQSDDLTKKTTTNNTVNTNCTNPYKQTPYNTNTGCDNMGQNTGYYCASSMLQKMFYRLGYKVGQYELAQIMGTTTSGTSHQGIETGIAYVGRKYNVKFKVTWKNFSELGFEGIAKLFCKKNTAVGNHILYRDQYGHYEYPLIINTKENTIKVINSLGNRCGNCYCGYIEERSFNTHKRYLQGISQKSILIIEKE